jgi:hypothetical protein
VLAHSRRAVAIGLFVVLFPQLEGCHHTVQRDVSTLNAPGEKPISQERIVGLTTLTGRVYEFKDTFPVRIQDDTIFGVVGDSTRKFAVHDVQRVWVRRSSPGRTVALTVGILVGAFVGTVAIAVATKNSCPFIYAWDGHQYVFDAEPYGGAVSRGLERDDYAELTHLTADHGTYRLLLTNEVNETQYTNQIQLLAVDHAPGIVIKPDEFGHLYAFGSVTPLGSARDQAGRDLTPWLASTDQRVWEPAPVPNPDGSIRQDIRLTFPRPAGATQAYLITNAGTAMWGGMMIRDMLALRGDSLVAWYRAMDHDSAARAAIHAWNLRDELFALKIQVEEPTGWEVRGVIPGGGPFLTADRVVALDVSHVLGDSLHLRIRPPSGFWALNSFAVAYSSIAGVTVDTLALASAVTESGRDVRAALTSADTQYYAMPTNNDRAYLTFAAPPQRPGTVRTVFVHARGYYSIHIDPKGPPDVATLIRFTQVPDAAARLSADKFARRQVAQGSAP